LPPGNQKRHGPEAAKRVRAGSGRYKSAGKMQGTYSSVTEPRVSIFSRVFLAASALA